MEKLPFKYRFIQFVADNYVSLYLLGFLAGVAVGVFVPKLLSSNG